jgi:uncharacterized protein
MSGTNPEAAILVFARAPVPGAAKTRLIPLLGAAGAAALHARLIERALATARAAAPEIFELWCTPDAAHPFLQSAALAHGATLRIQQGSDLGERMAHALADALRRGNVALCIGTDCPALTAQHLRDAAAALHDGNDAVFVPAEDGGYALVGLARDAPRLFRGIVWGGSQVMAETRTRLRELGLRWRELETLWDVDRPADYQRLQQSGLLRDARAPV